MPIPGDTLSLFNGTATFADKNVGTGKTVTLAGAVLAGSDAANYSLTSVNTTTANITVASLTITASSPADMLVHGPVPTITPAYTGFVTGDNAANSLDPQPTCSTNYTVTSAVGTYTTSCTGAVATNYTITTVAGSFKVLFLWDGFLQPINDTAHDVHTTAPFSKFKLGQTIPAKFDLKDANGNAVTQTGNPTFNYRKIGASCTDYVEAETLDLAYMPSSVPLFMLSGGHYQVQLEHQGTPGWALLHLRQPCRWHVQDSERLLRQVSEHSARGRHNAPALNLSRSRRPFFACDRDLCLFSRNDHQPQPQTRRLWMRPSQAGYAHRVFFPYPSSAPPEMM